MRHEPANTTAPRLRRHETLRMLGRAARTRRGTIGLILVGFVVAVAAIGPFVAPDPPTSFATIPFSGPSPGHLLGGDILGRDVLSRVLAGGWQLLLMAAASTALGIVLGASAGIAAAYLRGWSDTVIMRSVDVFLAFPGLVFALVLLSLVGPSVSVIVLAVGISHAPQVARVARSATLDVAERDFVKAAELRGVASVRVMTREILPNLVSPLMVEIGLRFIFSVVTIAGLSFLGLGIQPPAANWGLMINENRPGVTSNVWGVLAPVVLLAVVTIGMNLFTDAFARVALGFDRPAEEIIMTAAQGGEGLL